jgi:RNA polymerase sigma-70 factor (ECF subfamily)
MTPELQAQFQRLLEEHKRILYKVAALYSRTPVDREDVAQEIVVQLWRSFPTYDASHRFSTWMYRVGLNVAISARDGADAARAVRRGARAGGAG